jgi:hypothetical protein
VRLAEHYLRKGSSASIEGKREILKWQDQSLQDRQSTDVTLGPMTARWQCAIARSVALTAVLNRVLAIIPPGLRWYAALWLSSARQAVDRKGLGDEIAFRREVR